MEQSSHETDYTVPLIPLMTRRIVELFDPLQIILFGSRARGDHHPESDVDLLVVLPKTSSRFQSAVAIRQALKDIRPAGPKKRPVGKDIIVATPEDMAYYGDLECYVFYWALREGKVLYDRSETH